MLNIDTDRLEGKGLQYTSEYKSKCEALTHQLRRKLMSELSKQAGLGDWYIEFDQLSVQYPKYYVNVYTGSAEDYKEIRWVLYDTLCDADLTFHYRHINDYAVTSCRSW